jgi:RHS repeat-associated protein
VVNSADLAMLIGDFQAAQPDGALSHPEIDNPIGWDGYVFDRESGLYTVRFRTYETGLGRWIERDPAEYVDGASIWQFAKSKPISKSDFSGLAVDQNCDRIERRFGWQAPKAWLAIAKNFGFHGLNLRAGYRAKICKSCCEKPDVYLSVFGMLEAEVGSAETDLLDLRVRAGWYGRLRFEGEGSAVIRGCGGPTDFRVCATIGVELGLILSASAGFEEEASVGFGGRGGVYGSGQVCLVCHSAAGGVQCDIRAKVCAELRLRTWFSISAFGLNNEWIYEFQHQFPCLEATLGTISF